MGLSAQNVRLPLTPGSFYGRLIAKGETTFSEPFIEPIAEALPRLIRPLSGQVAALLSIKQGFTAPMRVGDQMHGLLIVTGTNLTEADAPAVTVFANQTVIALENVRLYQKAQRQAEALRESEERFRLAFENANIGVCLMDLEGRLTRVNHRKCEIFGYSQPELESMTVNDIAHPEDVNISPTFIQRAISGVESASFEKRYLHKRGHIVWGQVSSSLVRDAQGAPQYFISHVQDITERKQALEAIDNLAKFPSENPNPVLRADKDGTLLYASPSSRLLLNFWNVQTGQPLPEAGRNLVLDSLASGQNQEVEVECGAITYSFVLAPIAERGYVNLYGRDVTERERAEAAQRQSEERFRILFEQAADSILLLEITPEGIPVIRDANSATFKLLGYDRDELIGQRVSFIDAAPDASKVVEKRRQNILSGVGQVFEVKHQCKDGAIREFECSVTEIQIGSKVFGISVERDITERKRAEEKAQMFSAELERSNAELQQFAYAASHDLQEPLRMVTGFLQVLAQRYQGRLDAEADEFIGFAVDGAQRMQRLIADLLAYSRVGTQGQPLQPADGEAILQLALQNLQVTLEENQAQVTHDPLPTVLADEGQLVQVFQNLIGNAVKFHGQEPPRIHVSAQRLPPLSETGEGRGGGEWVFSVRDNGIGIDPQQSDRIFMIFQRLHGRAEYPGSGLGLAICKKIVERHGGRIWVESQPGQGSTFYFTLPAKAL